MPYPYGYNPCQMQQNSASIPSNVIKVKGGDGADGFIGLPNNNYVLMDEDENVFYYVVFDQFGHRSKTTCDFTVREEDSGEFATKQDIATIQAQLAALMEVVNAKQPVSEASAEPESKQPAPSGTRKSARSGKQANQ